jgi:hypothetical protein
VLQFNHVHEMFRGLLLGHPDLGQLKRAAKVGPGAAGMWSRRRLPYSTRIQLPSIQTREARYSTSQVGGGPDCIDPPKTDTVDSIQYGSGMHAYGASTIPSESTSETPARRVGRASACRLRC